MGMRSNKTKIVCTIGPACHSREVMEKMLRAGMNVARLNFSHGEYESHSLIIENLRAAAAATRRRLAIMADLPGPKIRIGRIKREQVSLQPGDTLTLTTEEIVGDNTRVSVTLDQLPRIVHRGHLPENS